MKDDQYTKDINIMRLVDRRFGIPVCFILGVAHRIARLLSFSSHHWKNPRKILFIKPSEIGGIILSYPLLSRIKRDYPQAELFFLTFEVNQDLFAVWDVIPAENILTIRHDSILTIMKDALRVILRLRRMRIDVVFDLEFFSRFTAIISYLSGASKRIGFYPYSMEGLYRGNLQTHNIPYNPHLHISKMYLSMAQAIEQNEKNAPDLVRNFRDGEIALPEFVPAPGELKKMRTILAEQGFSGQGRLFLINPGEGRLPLREWPLENYIEVVRRLLEAPQNYVVIAGTSNGKEKAERIHASIPDKRCFSLSGKTSLREMLTLFTMAEALITNDSGLAHLASLTKIKQFIFFGPESPQVFSPLTENIHIFYAHMPCSPCLSVFNHRESKCDHHRCLKAISPQEIYKVLAEKSYAVDVDPIGERSLDKCA